MTKYLLSFLSALTLALNAGAVTVDSRGAGSLHEAFTDPSGVLVLKINGEIDASDLFYISGAMSSLTSLDLKDAVIVAYKGPAIHGISEYAANTIPTGSFTHAGLTSVSFPSAPGLVIGDASFAGSALENVTVAGTSATIGAGTFSACPKLTAASVSGATLSNHTFAGCPALKSVTLTGVAVIPASAFANCSNLAEVKGTQDVTELGDKAFAGCTALKSFTFGAPLTGIAAGTFEGAGLELADLSGCKVLKSIGSWAFAGNTSLKAVNLPDGVTRMGEGIFFNCPVLAEVRYPANMTEIPAYTFKGDGTLDISGIIQDGVTTIGGFAMKDVAGAKAVTVPQTVKYIATGAMEGMTGLERVDVQRLSSVPDLGADVWKGVDQSNVELHVLNTMSDEFAAAEQWCDFKFMISTGINNVIAPEATDTRSVEGFFSGNDLRLRSRGREIVRTDVFLPSGSLVISDTTAGNEVVISTGHVGGRIFIVECTLNDGSVAAVKLLRK